jgi:hypothetical protein
MAHLQMRKAVPAGIRARQSCAVAANSMLFPFVHAQCQGFQSCGVSHTCGCILQAWGFDDERLSCLFGIIKVVHTASVAQQLTIERSFAFFKDTLINHSIQR